jgi:predicted Rossmann fold nucleotide-binding protein DprA/Smf involved in DNA uptake
MSAISLGIVGYRYYNDYETFVINVEDIINSEGIPHQIVSGGATGADTLAKKYADENDIQIIEYYPKSYNAKELLARNTLIVNDSDIIIAFVSKSSRGTYDTINKARRMRKKVFVINID